MMRIGVVFMLGALAACQVTEPGEDVAVEELQHCHGVPFQYGTWNGQVAPVPPGSIQVVMDTGSYSYIAAVVDPKAVNITWGVTLTSKQLRDYMAINRLGPIIVGPGGGIGGGGCHDQGPGFDCDEQIKAVGVLGMKMFDEAGDLAATCKL